MDLWTLDLWTYLSAVGAAGVYLLLCWCVIGSSRKGPR